jgi:formate-dependent nitrite reductase membrane component NrfD
MPEGRDLVGGVESWDGRSYYGRRQLKPAPFNRVLVGTYVFLAGLSGGTQLLATTLDLARGREAEPTVRRGRYLSLLAPVFGSVGLILDLHMPRRFYNMLRVFKPTSPMSIGSWILVTFSGLSAVTAGAQFVADRASGLGWLHRLARVGALPAAVAGMGMGTYTASLLAATSTPLWAAAPKRLAVRFGASSVASAAAAMALGERNARVGRDLDSVVVAALAVELAATLASADSYRRLDSDAMAGEIPGAALPLGLLLGSLVITRGRFRLLSSAVSLAVLAGSFAMRVRVLAEGDRSACRPDVTMRFAQPD